MLGFQRAVQPLGELPVERRWIYLIGLAESLNAVALALAAGFIVCLLLAAGFYRSAVSTAGIGRQVPAQV